MKRRSVKLDLPYLSPERSRHGKDKLYVRRFGRRILIAETPGTPAFMVAYADAVKTLSARARTKSTAPAMVTHPPGTLGWLAAKYFASTEFRDLNAKSKAARRGVIEGCLAEKFTDAGNEPVGNCPLVHFDAGKAKRLRDLKADLPGAANNRKKYLSSMFAWALDQTPPLAVSNPLRDVARMRYATEGFHSWTVDEVEQYRARHPIGTKARLALEMLLFLGVRRGDLVELGRQHVRGDKIKFIPRKTRHRRRRLSEKPLLPELVAVVGQSPCGELTFLVNDLGAAFTANGFGNWFRDRCDEAGLPQCSAHGLRKAAATLAAENGATVNQLMAIFDWDTPAMAKVYTDAADRKRLAEDAMHLLVRTDRA